MKSRLSLEDELKIVESIKNKGDSGYKQILTEYEISYRILGGIRKKYNLWDDGKTKPISKDRSAEILDYMQKNPHATYNNVCDVFKCTYKQAVRIRKLDNELPNLMAITVRKKHNVYMNPELERELLDYMQKNPQATYDDIYDKFGCSDQQTSRIRRRAKMPNIKRRPRNTHQSILRKSNQRYCSVCRKIKDLSEFANGRMANCHSCEKERYKRRCGIGDLHGFLNYKLKQSYRRTSIINTLTFDDLLDLYNKQNGKCFYSGREMVFENNNNYSLSLDRISSSIGYHKDNVVLCCRIVNYMKQEYDVNLFYEICKDITNHHNCESVNHITGG